MELEHLQIRRRTWDKDNPVVGEIKFTTSSGSVEIKLTEQHCQRILAVVADALVEQATEAANNLRGAVIEAASCNQLEHKDKD